MGLNVGARLGPYEVTGPLGAGGMGEVYRARDTNLGRDVAIKVLPASFTSDANRVARFELEAKTLASLNHPNIAHIYGLERVEGTTALATELVEGPTLDGRIAKGRVPIDEALLRGRFSLGVACVRKRRKGERSSKPLPSNIAGAALSIRATRVADCLAAAKWYRKLLCRPGVNALNARLKCGSLRNRSFSSSGNGKSEVFFGFIRSPAFSTAIASRT